MVNKLSPMKFNLLKVIGLPLRSITRFCDGPPARGRWGWRPLERGCRYSGWGLRQMRISAKSLTTVRRIPWC